VMPMTIRGAALVFDPDMSLQNYKEIFNKFFWSTNTRFRALGCCR
jgi:hypothetical protein